MPRFKNGNGWGTRTHRGKRVSLEAARVGYNSLRADEDKASSINAMSMSVKELSFFETAVSYFDLICMCRRDET